MTTIGSRAHDLPEELPEGEIVLWQGRPSWRSLALQAFHIRKIAIYFGLILMCRIALEVYRQASLSSIAADAAPLLLVAAGAIALSASLAWLYGRTTVYTITNRRVFMRFGAALPMMLNIPFRIVGAAGLKVHRDGTADIPLRLMGTGRVTYPQLWPHARPWRLTHPEPMLRSLPDGAKVASLLATALSASTPPPVAQSMLVDIARKADAGAFVASPALSSAAA
jgi:hypothetical protein